MADGITVPNATAGSSLRSPVPRASARAGCKAHCPRPTSAMTGRGTC